MRTRWALSAALVVVLLGALTLAFQSLAPRPGVTKANFDRIQTGMSHSDVEEIFGGPHSHTGR